MIIVISCDHPEQDGSNVEIRVLSHDAPDHEAKSLATNLIVQAAAAVTGIMPSIDHEEITGILSSIGGYTDDPKRP